MNTVAELIAEFLKKFPPFDNLTFHELSEIANNIRVVNLEKYTTLFQIDDQLHDCFYVVASGVINLSVIADAEETLLNKCHEGDIFGLRPFFAKNNYMMTAKASQESILYAIPIDIFRPFVADNSRVLDFLLESFATNTSNSNDKNIRGKLLSDNVAYSDQKSSDMQYFQSLTYNKLPLITSPDNVIFEVAKVMAESHSNCIIICNNHKQPIGIATHTDLSTKIATGRFPITATIDKIMSSPVVTVVENISLAEAQLVMLKNNVTHLIATIDGTNQSEIKGIISEHDLIVSQANNPGVLVKQIKRAQFADELKLLRGRLNEIIQNCIQKNIPLFHIYDIASEVNLALIKRSVELAILDLGSPPARFAWFCIGSQGRKEQLLLTDQDSFLVFEDVLPNKYRDVKDYFLKLAKLITANIEIIGYSTCPNGHMGSITLWCKSLSEWTDQFNNWMDNPGKNSKDISSIFFDYEMAFGEAKIEEAIENVIFKNAINKTLFFDFLGNDALRNNAPLGFFKKFNVEEEGPNKDKFDIKSLALLPLIDSARLFTLSFGFKGVNNTYSRFKQLAIVDPRNAEIYINCAEAFLILSKFKTLEGLKNEDSGQYINLNELNKLDKERLKNALTPMKELEELIKDKFQLTQFS